MRRPHPFFLAYLGALAAGSGAAAAAPAGRPAWALHSAWLLRAEVGLAVLASLYLVALLGLLGWRGRVPRRLELGGLVLETAEEIDEQERKAHAALDELRQALTYLSDRVDSLEGREVR